MNIPLGTYIHVKSGNRYVVVGEMKFKFDAKWYPAVEYHTEHLPENRFARTPEDFLQSFIKAPA